jgi:phosphatidylglycerophosphate synthase
VKDPKGLLVKFITELRLVCALVLLGAGPLHWWWLAAVALGVGIVTDLVDGPLARRWYVTSESGAILHAYATVALTFCAMVGAQWGGAWYWWVAIVVALAGLFLAELRPRLRGGWDALRTVVRPAVNITLLGALMTTFVGHWLHADYATVGALVFVAGVFVAIAKAEDIKRTFDLAKNYPR